MWLQALMETFFCMVSSMPNVKWGLWPGGFILSADSFNWLVDEILSNCQTGIYVQYKCNTILLPIKENVQRYYYYQILFLIWLSMEILEYKNSHDWLAEIASGRIVLLTRQLACRCSNLKLMTMLNALFCSCSLSDTIADSMTYYLSSFCWIYIKSFAKKL